MTAETLPAGVHPTVAQVAVALVAAHAGRLPNDVFSEVLDDANPRDVAVFLAATLAGVLADRDGDPKWLQRFGLAVAEGVA